MMINRIKFHVFCILSFILQTLLKTKGVSIMNNKETSMNKQIKNKPVNYNVENKDAILVDSNIGKQDGTSSYPFYTPPGEDHQPRITSN